MRFLLANFATALDAALVEKGKRWYSEGMVQNVKNTNDCVWNADIIGPNKQFKVQVEIVGKEVDHVFCACGPKLCSHVVALLFDLVEKEYPTEKYYAGAKAKTAEEGAVKVVHSPLTKALQNADVYDLKAFINKYAADNPAFQESFLKEFGQIDIEDQVARFKSVIKSTLKFDSMKDAMDGTRRVLKEAEKNIKTENFEIAFAACKAVLTEWAAHVYHEKHAGYVFSDALEQLHDLVLSDDIPESLQPTLFNYIFQLYKRSDIEDYQEGEFWTDAFIFSASSKEDLEKVMALIDARVEKGSSTSRKGFLEHRHAIEKAIKEYY